MSWFSDFVDSVKEAFSGGTAASLTAAMIERRPALRHRSVRRL
jgi:hypothetical protein